MFATMIPDWRVADTFLSGPQLNRLRILAIEPVTDPDGARDTFNAVWLVEPVDD